MKELVKKVGERNQDNLIAGLFPRALTVPVSIAAGAGELALVGCIPAHSGREYEPLFSGSGDFVSLGDNQIHPVHVAHADADRLALGCVDNLVVLIDNPAFFVKQQLVGVAYALIDRGNVEIKRAVKLGV